MTPREQLETIGRALYGEQWQSAMARGLLTTHQTIWRWITGRSPAPEDLQERLLALAARRVESINRAINKLKGLNNA